MKRSLRHRGKLLVLGATPFQIPLIKKARELGYTVWAASNRKGDPGLRVADRGCEISILDFPALEDLWKTENFCAVVTGASDLGTLAVGHLNTRFGLPGLTEEQARSVSDKGRFLRLQEELALPRPAFFQVDGIAELEHAVARIDQYPVVLKPFFASGSRGVRVAWSADDVRAAHPFVSRQSSLRKGCVIQTYLDGVEHGGECLVEEGRVVFLELTHKFLNEHHVPVGHGVPFDVTSDIRRELSSQIQKIVDRLEVRHSPVNIDVIITPQHGPVIIDFSFRLGGNLLPQLMQHRFGVDTIERCIDYCCPDELPPRILEPGNLLKKGTGSEPASANTARNGCRELPVPLFQQAAGANACCGAIIFGSPVSQILSEEMIRSTRELYASRTKALEVVFDLPAGARAPCFDQGSHRFGHALFEVADIQSYREILDAFRAIMGDCRALALEEVS